MSTTVIASMKASPATRATPVAKAPLATKQDARFLISSDALGELGGLRFQALCQAAQLGCHRSNRPRADWFFNVEVDTADPPGPAAGQQAPVACQVQVKTVQAGTASIKLKLSMAQALAQDARPGFVCVFQLDESQEIAQAYLLPIAQKRLAAIVRRLRQEGTLSPPRPLHTRFIRFALEPCDRIGASGPQLRAALQNACTEPSQA